MRGKERDLLTLRKLAAMPFVDRLELAAVSGVADRSAYDAVAALERRGLAASVPHATGLLRTTRRFHLTAQGIHLLASLERVDLDQLLRRRPVSARWRRILLERLDAVAVVYRLASAIAAESGPLALRWYRAAPLDAALTLADGRTLGLVRLGPTADRTGFAKRMWRLREGPLPGAVLLLAPDQVRLRHARRLLDGWRIPVLLALEEDAVLAGPAEPVWRLPAVAAALDLRRVLSGHLERGGRLPAEAQLRRIGLPEDIELDGLGKESPDWLLPALLKPAAKQLLDLLHDWPGISPEHLRSLLGVSRARLYETMAFPTEVGLIRRVSIGGRRLALSDRGLALLARRDRASVGAARRRWSVAPVDSNAPEEWRNVSGRNSRQLLRNAEHTGAVHAFLAALSRQARSMGWKVLQLDPPSRASCYFRHQGGLRSVNPDAFGILRRNSTTWPFFLEWERRAVRPATMAQRLAPYLRYYSTQRPLDDHGVQPIVLVVFDDELAATHFLGLAARELDRTRLEIPLAVSHRALLEREGPMGSAWLRPGQWEKTVTLAEVSPGQSRPASPSGTGP